MTDEQDVKKRIKELLRVKHVSENQLSKLGRLSQKVLNNQLSHGANLPVSTVLFILEQFPGVSADWIMKGEGTMYPEAQDLVAPQPLPDFSGMVNTVVSAKDETIEALNGKIAAKDETIEALNGKIASMEDLIVELKHKVASAYLNEEESRAFNTHESSPRSYKGK